MGVTLLCVLSSFLLVIVNLLYGCPRNRGNSTWDGLPAQMDCRRRRLSARLQYMGWIARAA